MTGKRRDGSRFSLYLSVSEVQCNGQTLFTGFARDLTERKEHEAKDTKLRDEFEELVLLPERPSS